MREGQCMLLVRDNRHHKGWDSIKTLHATICATVCVCALNRDFSLGTVSSAIAASTVQASVSGQPVHKVFMNQPEWGISPILQYVATIVLHAVPWCNPLELFKRREWSTLQAHPQEEDVGNV